MPEAGGDELFSELGSREPADRQGSGHRAVGEPHGGGGCREESPNRRDAGENHTEDITRLLQLLVAGIVPDGRAPPVHVRE